RRIGDGRRRRGPGAASTRPPAEGSWKDQMEGEVVGYAAASGLEAELVQEGSQVVLEVRSREPAWNHQLVRFALRGASTSGVEEGFLVLAPDVDGWYTASTAFSATALYGRMGGACQEVVAAAPELERLTPEEWRVLLAAAIRDQAQPAAA